MGAGGAYVFAIDRLPTPALTIPHYDGASQRIGLIERLVVGRHLLLQGRQIDMHQQPASGGGAGDARTGRVGGLLNSSAAWAYDQLTIASTLV